MAYRLSVPSLHQAIRHLTHYGDTDVFPHLPELSFLREQEGEVVAELALLDLDVFDPVGAIEALAPKSRYGFRIVHQLPFVDSVLLLAAVIEISPNIECRRQKPGKHGAFSYRFSTGERGSIFAADRSYKDWLMNQRRLMDGNLGIKQVITTDISDFYARINFHRLENLLEEIAPQHGAVRYILKHIKVIRAKQSFGLPVGGSAARILAELALCDTDLLLMQEELIWSRFVDDFRIFLRAENDPYDVLALLAEQLGLSEGLSLNVSKTRVYSRLEFMQNLKNTMPDIADEATGVSLEWLTSHLYFDDDQNVEDIEKLKKISLLSILQEEITQTEFDMGMIKIVFRALKIARPPEAIEYIKQNFSELTVFAKELCLLMEALCHDDPSSFDDMTESVIKSVFDSPACSVQLIKTWIVELFVRGIVPIRASDMKRLQQSSASIDRRQQYLIRGRIKQQSFFRNSKTKFAQIPPMEQPCFIWGASCLPKDEFETWLQTIKPQFTGPLSDLFMKWLKKERPRLISKLSGSGELLHND